MKRVTGQNFNSDESVKTGDPVPWDHAFHADDDIFFIFFKRTV
jgi:hypothetical protein